MTTRIAEFFAETFCKHKLIERETISAYRYGVEIILSTIIGAVMVLTIGILFHEVRLTILYYVVFCSVRQFTGGYHAETYWRCKIVLALVTSSVLLFAKLTFLLSHYSIGIHVLFLLFSLTATAVLSPIENVNKPMTQKQRIKCGNIARILTLAFSVISFPVLGISAKAGCVISITLFWVSVMLIVEFVKRGGTK